MTKQELIQTLKITVTYKSKLRQHYLGPFNLSNKGLRETCSKKLGSKYDDLSDKEKKILIDDMFIELRGESNE